MVKAIVFVAVSAGILLISWSSLRDPRSHGFYRFFVFESTLVLILLNADYWFANPFSVRQIISWLLLLFSLILAVHGFYLLRVIGKPKGNIENTSNLVVVGAYKVIRHPLYSSLLPFGLGAFLKQPSFLGGALCIVVFGFLVATAKVEERENLAKFGTDYAEYMKTTKMLIPFFL